MQPTTILSQTFSFAPTQKGVDVATVAGSFTCAIDGSATVAVGFITPFQTTCQNVAVTYTPTTPDGNIITPQVTNVTNAGFSCTAFGGPVGATGTFSYQAYGV